MRGAPILAVGLLMAFCYRERIESSRTESGTQEDPVKWLSVGLVWCAVSVASPVSAITFDVFLTPSTNNGAQFITAGPDQALWFTETFALPARTKNAL